MALGPDPRFVWSRAISFANDSASSRWSEIELVCRGVEGLQKLIRSYCMIKCKTG